MRIKGVRMICKVSRGKTLKTDPRRFLVGLGIWCRTLGQLSSSVRHVHERARPDENLPKWSWSPLSRRSSSWSWSRSSVSCDVGVHQSNCRGPCRTFDSSAKGRNFELNFPAAAVWEVALPAPVTLLCFVRTRTCGVPKGGKNSISKG